MRESPTTEGRGFDQHILRLPIATKTLGSFSNRGYSIGWSASDLFCLAICLECGRNERKLKTNRPYRVVLSYFNQFGRNTTLFHCMNGKWCEFHRAIVPDSWVEYGSPPFMTVSDTAVLLASSVTSWINSWLVSYGPRQGGKHQKNALVDLLLRRKGRDRIWASWRKGMGNSGM